MTAFDIWLRINALDFLVNSSPSVQGKVEYVGISSSSGQNQTDLWCIRLREWNKMNENAMSSLRPGDRAANSACHLKLWLQLFTAAGRKNAVGRSCSASWLRLFIQLYQMSCIIDRWSFVLGQKNVLGKIMDCSCDHSGWGRSGDEGRPHHSILCF